MFWLVSTPGSNADELPPSSPCRETLEYICQSSTPHDGAILVPSRGVKRMEKMRMHAASGGSGPASYVHRGEPYYPI
jgi:hypothetical protein